MSQRLNPNNNSSHGWQSGVNNSFCNSSQSQDSYDLNTPHNYGYGGYTNSTATTYRPDTNTHNSTHNSTMVPPIPSSYQGFDRPGWSSNANLRSNNPMSVKSTNQCDVKIEHSDQSEWSNKLDSFLKKCEKSKSPLSRSQRSVSPKNCSRTSSPSISRERKPMIKSRRESLETRNNTHFDDRPTSPKYRSKQPVSPEGRKPHSSISKYVHSRRSTVRSTSTKYNKHTCSTERKRSRSPISKSARSQRLTSRSPSPKYSKRKRSPEGWSSKRSKNDGLQVGSSTNIKPGANAQRRIISRTQGYQSRHRR